MKIIALAAVLAVGVSYVSAFTSPNGTVPTVNPDNNVPAPINIGALVQTKIGSLTTESFFKAGTNSTPGLPGWIIAANGTNAPDNGGVTSPWQFFQKEYLINKPGTFAQMKVGSHIAGRPNSPLPSVDKTKFDPKDASIPLTIDLIDRGTGNNSDAGTQVMDLLAGDVCNNATTVQTNTAGIQFWSTKNINPNTNTAGDNADVIARGIQIGDSSAGAMKVLVATDTAGNAVWGTMRIANGQVVVDYPGSSDVATGQACGVAPAVTYSWVPGAWSACTMNGGSDWRDFYSTGPMSTVGQSCTAWINSQTQNNGTQTRTPVCLDSNGLPSTLCDPAAMPSTFQTCTVPVQVRVKITTDNLGTQTVNYTDPGQCLYSKLQEPTNPDPLANMFPLGCQVRTTSQATPAGFQPSARCNLLNFSGGPGYGFNAGNPGGWTATGSGTWQLQIKPQ